MRYIDLSRTLDGTLPVYPGDPVPVVTQTNTVEKDGFTLSEVNSGTHVGTHMDAPLHFIENGEKMDSIHVERFFGRGILLDGRSRSSFDETLLSGIDLKKGDIVLIITGWGNRITEEAYFTDYPEITLGLAERLVAAGVSIVGTDSASPDHDPYATHKKLLGNGILILENLTNLDQLLGASKFSVVALPAKYSTEAAPARVVAMLS